MPLDALVNPGAHCVQGPSSESAYPSLHTHCGPWNKGVDTHWHALLDGHSGSQCAQSGPTPPVLHISHVPVGCWMRGRKAGPQKHSWVWSVMSMSRPGPQTCVASLHVPWCAILGGAHRSHGAWRMSDGVAPDPSTRVFVHPISSAHKHHGRSRNAPTSHVPPCPQNMHVSHAGPPNPLKHVHCGGEALQSGIPLTPQSRSQYAHRCAVSSHVAPSTHSLHVVPVYPASDLQMQYRGSPGPTPQSTDDVPGPKHCAATAQGTQRSGWSDGSTMYAYPGSHTEQLCAGSKCGRQLQCAASTWRTPCASTVCVVCFSPRSTAVPEPHPKNVETRMHCPPTSRRAYPLAHVSHRTPLCPALHVHVILLGASSWWQICSCVP